MKDRVRLPVRFDPQRLQADLKGLQDAEWINHFVKQNYEGAWDIIPLRSAAGAKHPVMMIYPTPGCTEFVDTPFLDQCPYYQEVLSYFECPLHSVRLMRLSVGSNIKEHTDLDLSFEDGSVRLHIPVVTNPDVDFRLNRERVELREGECWYLRLSDPHSVANRGQVDRIHLVIDAAVNPWLTAILESANEL